MTVFLPTFLDTGSNVAIMEPSIFMALCPSFNTITANMDGIQSRQSCQADTTYFTLLSDDEKKENVYTISGRIPHNLLPSEAVLCHIAQELGVKMDDSNFALFSEFMAKPVLLLPIQHSVISCADPLQFGALHPTLSPFLQCYTHTLSQGVLVAGMLGFSRSHFPPPAFNGLAYCLPGANHQN